jgi:xylulose-5-phosphate/fructose-6-phosphate phosphoketolase
LPENRDRRLAELDTFFRAANYLGAAQLYLCANPLLRETLRPEHIKRRLLGHWGTQPGLNLIYGHLSRLIQDTGQRTLFVAGTGHGAPGVLACLWLEGTLGQAWPNYAQTSEGLARLVHDFSWPGGWPSHLTAMTPGTLHEGGELGYALLHAAGAAFDNPDLLVACVVGDGEAETGPAAASWHCTKFLDPRRDGTVLPILHLNGYKLSGPTLLARMDNATLGKLFEGYGWSPIFVAGEGDTKPVHPLLWNALDRAHAEIAAIRAAGRADAAWPMIVLRTPKGWTCPATLDGKKLEGTFHAHQIPIEDPRENPAHLAALEQWLRGYGPETLFGDDGRPGQQAAAVFPEGGLRMGQCPQANGGTLLRALPLPNAVPVDVPAPGQASAAATMVLGDWLRDLIRADQAGQFRLFCPDETASNRLQAVFEATDRTFEEPLLPSDEHLSRAGRVMEILSEHCCQGWLEGYLLSGRHGLFACYEAFVSIIDSMMQQYAKWQKMAHEIAWRAPISSLNYLLTSHVWEQDHNGYSHQGPTFINSLMTRKSNALRIFLPPDANCLLAVMHEVMESRDRINLVVASKKPLPQWLSWQAAQAHCAAGASMWEWAGHGAAPDVVLAAAGDVPTREVVAAAELLERLAPTLAVRVVNVVDLLCLDHPEHHASGLSPEHFAALFTEEAPVVMAFHGYPGVVYELLYKRPQPNRFHVHGYQEEGTTTTPFDMLVRNDMSRWNLAIAALRFHDGGETAVTSLREMIARQQAYIAEHGEDPPDVVEWKPARAA